MKTKRPIRSLIFIMVVSIISLVLAMPKEIPIKFSAMGKTASYTLARPHLDLSRLRIPFTRDLEFKMGLDIRGGTRVVLEADMSKIVQADRETALESARNVISRRVDLFGVGESAVKTSRLGETYRIIAELPGVTNTQQAVQIIGSTAQLDFREEASSSAPLTPGTIDQLLGGHFVPTGLMGKDLKRATVQFSSETSEPVVNIEFNDEGKKKFAEITTRNIKKRVAIFLDEFPVSVPVVNEPILNGSAIISGGFTVDAAKQLSIQLNAGALPVPITIVQQETVDASLGTEAVQKTAIAGLVGVGLVALFMVLYYGWKGLLADLALGVYALITIAIYKLVPVTLTLPGIAGLLLSIGMAVDSNILIFERMKEELRMGKPFDLAMTLGFGRAWDSIKDANVATLFTCFILFNPFEFEFLNRSGMVRGFALTLALGIFVSLFTGIVVTRTFLRLFLKESMEKKDIQKGTRA